MVNQLITNLLAIFRQLPDPRTGSNCQFPFEDIATAAFSAFFMQCPSFLDHQRRFQEANNRHTCQSLFAMPRIPSDNHIRHQLDGIDCQLLYPAFDMVLEKLIEHQALGDFLRLDSIRARSACLPPYLSWNTISLRNETNHATDCNCSNTSAFLHSAHVLLA